MRHTLSFTLREATLDIAIEKAHMICETYFGYRSYVWNTYASVYGQTSLFEIMFTATESNGHE